MNRSEINWEMAFDICPRCHKKMIQSLIESKKFCENNGCPVILDKVSVRNHRLTDVEKRNLGISLF